MWRNELKYNRLALIPIFLVFAYLLVPGSPAIGKNSQLRLGNGLEIRLYSPEDVTAMTTKDSSGRLILRLEDDTSYELIGDVSDPQIMNKGDGSFHPLNVDWVIEALEKVDVSGSNVNMPVNVYVLPMPRSGLLASSACGDNIFLAPGVREVGRCVVACTVTHELGHVFQFRFAPQGEGTKWPEYLELRRIDNTAIYSDLAPRMNRPVEIFAEDFRYLFGGSEACSSGMIENPDLPLPGEVDGLKDFFVALVAPAGMATAGPLTFALSNYPNPFNPSTTIRIALDGSLPANGGEVDVSIYRIDGSLVRNLYRGKIAAEELSLPWDGRDDRGRAVSSGMYFYAVRAAGQKATGKMLLVR
jgi:hypothetical protein